MASEEHPGFGNPPFTLYHFNGKVRATFTDSNPAWWCWNGMDALSRTYFHFKDRDGNIVNPRCDNPGHAYTLLEKVVKP